MPYVTVGRENSAAIDLYYEDHGLGDPVVLVHGYLLDGRSWEKQEAALLAAGYRVITYDRRGFGGSSRPSVGYDYDTLAADLAALLDQLDLRDTVLAGYCAGGGEVVRYLGSHGSARVRAAALLAPLSPGLTGANDNPRGMVEDFIRQIVADRPSATKTFLDRSYSIDLFGGVRVSDQAWQNSFHVAIGASAAAVLGCAAAWLEDFRDDLARITVPLLVVQGGQDLIAPPGTRVPAGNDAPAARHVLIADGPHAITWTHAQEVNEALLGFMQSTCRYRADATPAQHGDNDHSRTQGRND
ncbi:MAG TPA: alpha/beta hydrolase [Streptosporangiaceae bacterium]|nr:alpha/beta hydrolase [Streptosporangiaceae bacterium]